MMALARNKLAVGLDIGSSSVKLVQLRRRKGGYALQAFGIAPLPPETIVDGALMNSAAVVQAIQSLLSSQKVKTKEVALGVRGHSVIIKKITLPRMSQEELDESMQWDAEQHIPFDVKDVNLDTQILGHDEASGQMDVLLVAAKKEMIQDFTSVCAEAGLSATVVDVDAFAVQNAWEASYTAAPGETIVLVNVGAAVTNVNIVQNGTTTFTRDVTMGGNAFTEEIQKELNISYDEAEALKIGGGHAESDAVVPQEVERIIQSVAEQLAGEIQRSLDFYAATAANHAIARIYLSGGTARVPAVFRTIEQRAAVPVEVLNPFKEIEADPRRFDPAHLNWTGATAAVAVGLALRRAGDKWQ
jgi:type IV pilus assembly protein PilM